MQKPSYYRPKRRAKTRPLKVIYNSPLLYLREGTLQGGVVRSLRYALFFVVTFIQIYYYQNISEICAAYTYVSAVAD